MRFHELNSYNALIAMRFFPRAGLIAKFLAVTALFELFLFSHLDLGIDYFFFGRQFDVWARLSIKGRMPILAPRCWMLLTFQLGLHV
jgi:hypothetical protein